MPSTAYGLLRRAQLETWSRCRGTSTQAYKNEIVESGVTKKMSGDLLGLAASACRGDFALKKIIFYNRRSAQRGLRQTSNVALVGAMRYPKASEK